MKYTEFTEKDFDIIDKAWQEFAGFAKERCSNDEEFAVVKKPMNLQMRRIRMSAGVRVNHIYSIL